MLLATSVGDTSDQICDIFANLILKQLKNSSEFLPKHLILVNQPMRRDQGVMSALN